MTSGGYSARYIKAKKQWFVVQSRMGGQPKTIAKYGNSEQTAAMNHAARLNREARKK